MKADLFPMLANEALFNAWKSLSRDAANLASIAQNDMLLTLQDFKDWQQCSIAVISKIEKLTAETTNHFESCKANKTESLLKIDENRKRYKAQHS